MLVGDRTCLTDGGKFWQPAYRHRLHTVLLSSPQLCDLCLSYIVVYVSILSYWWVMSAIGPDLLKESAAIGGPSPVLLLKYAADVLKLRRMRHDAYLAMNAVVGRQDSCSISLHGYVLASYQAFLSEASWRLQIFLFRPASLLIFVQ